MKNNYLRGFLGALVGGMVCTIPWVLIYVYLNYMFSILGAVIGFGAFFGYKLFGGKVTKKTSIIVIIASLISITLATFVVIPLLLLVKDELGLSWYYFNYLYNNGKFISAIIMDYIISVFFVFLGISGVILDINRQGAINECKETNDQTFVEIDKLSYEEQIKYLEDIYAKYDAFSKDKAVSEFKIMKDINIPNKISFIMKMEKAGIIVSPGIKSYFDKEAAKDPKKAKKNKKKAIWIAIAISVPVAIAAGLGTFWFIDFFASMETNANETIIKEQTYTYEKIDIMLPETFKEIPSDDSKSSVGYLNHGDGNIYQVMLQQENYANGIDIKSIRKLYVENLKNTFTILNEWDVMIDGMNGFALDLEYNADKGKEIYTIYAVTTDTEFIIVMFYTNLYDESTDILKENKIKEFKQEVSKYAETIKIKKS